MAGVVGPELLKLHPELESTCFLWLAAKPLQEDTSQPPELSSNVALTGYIKQSLLAFDLNKSELKAFVAWVSTRP